MQGLLDLDVSFRRRGLPSAAVTAASLFHPGVLLVSPHPPVVVAASSEPLPSDASASSPPLGVDPVSQFTAFSNYFS